MTEHRFQQAIVIVSERLAVSPEKAEVLMFEAWGAGKIQVDDEQYEQHEQQLIEYMQGRGNCSTAADDPYAAERAAAVRGAMARGLIIQHGVVKGLMAWLDSIKPSKTRKQTEGAKLGNASPKAIRAALRKVYNDAEHKGEKKPNSKTQVKPAKEILRTRGLKASYRQIQAIGDEPEFRDRRRPRGTFH
jgi:hypothetical protein